MSALQCSKRLHLEVRRPDLLRYPAGAASTSTGKRRIGAIARELLGAEDGVLLDRTWEPVVALSWTKELMREGVPAIYEATIHYDDVLAHIDILRREGDAWRLVDVRSTDEVNEERLKDCAIQAWVFQGAGYPLAGVSVAHIEPSFAYSGEGDRRGLFSEVDITDEVHARLRAVSSWVDHAARAIYEDEPEIRVGEQCNKPHQCPFTSHCWTPR